MSAALSDSHLHPDLDPQEILDGLEVSNLLKWFFVISAAVPMGNDAGVNEQQLVAPYFAFRQCYCSAEFLEADQAPSFMERSSDVLFT